MNSYRLFAGHIDWARLDQIEGDCFTFSVLRQPQERLVSYYFYLRAEASKLDPTSLAKPNRQGEKAALMLSPDEFFCEGGSPEVRNHLDTHFDNFYSHYFAERSFDTRRHIKAGKTILEAELLARAQHNLGRLDGLYSVGDLTLLQKDIIAACGQNGMGRWGTLRSLISPLQSIRQNSNAGDFVSRINDLKSLGATHRTFDRIDEMTRLDNVIWAWLTSKGGSARRIDA